MYPDAVFQRSFGERDPALAYRARPAAYAIILDDARRIACVFEESGGLFLPGGGIEPGEDPVAAVHREVAEECAHEFELLRTVGSAIQLHRTAAGPAYELQATFFLGRFGRPLDREPQHELRWLASGPEVPGFHHECHRWAVAEALRLAAP